MAPRVLVLPLGRAGGGDPLDAAFPRTLDVRQAVLAIRAGRQSDTRHLLLHGNETSAPAVAALAPMAKAFGCTLGTSGFTAPEASFRRVPLTPGEALPPGDEPLIVDVGLTGRPDDLAAVACLEEDPRVLAVWVTLRVGAVSRSELPPFRAALSEAAARGRVDVSGVPACVVREGRRNVVTVAGGRVVPVRRKGAPEQGFFCDDCAERHGCPGIWSESPTAPACWVQPVERVASNSYNLTLGEIVRAPDRADLHPARDLLIATDDGFRLASTDTGDFTDAELRWVRDTLGQVYLDVSEKALLDYFPDDLRKLVPWRGRQEAGPAWHAQTFEVLPEDIFLPEEEAHVNRRLRQLRGRVGDIGCGGLRYRAILDELLQRGAVTEFTAIEPTPDQATREYLASIGTLHAVDLEGYAGPGEAFDWLLVLRSYNHFRDLGTAIAQLERLLVPGGRLLVAENTPFGLARSREQIAHMVQTDELPFEHFRNHTSGQARRWFEAFGFRVLDEHPVSPTTSNQWILELERVG